MHRQWRKRIQAAAAVFLGLAAIFPASAAFCADTLPVLTAQDRLLVVAPHPDGEVPALGPVLQEAKEAQAAVKVVYLTHGEAEGRSILSYKRRPALSRSALIKKGRAAKQAAIESLKPFGLEESELIFLGYPDGGLMSLWVKHWAPAKPYRSLLTRINRVPFKEEPSYGHFYRGEELERDLEIVLLENAPTHVFVTAPSDPDADHQAAGLFLRAAMLDAAQRAPLAPSVHVFKDGKKVGEDAALVLTSIRKETIFHDTVSIVATFPKDKVTYRVIGEELWTGVPLPAAFDEMGVLSIYVFGYKEGTPFVTMPKFSFRLFGKKLFVYERLRSFHDKRVAYSVIDGRLLIRLPLTLLRQPRYIFGAARTAKRSMPDFEAWKLLEVI